MNVVEKAIVLNCEGQELIAILHLPEQPGNTGLLAVPAGSLQYRAGNGRHLVLLARSLAENGIPVMRFDYRGMGDSDGAYRGFEHIEKDLQVAVEAFIAELPSMRHIALYGGCEAATGILIHAHQISVIDRLILSNPWVGDEAITARATKKHYARRLREPDFWLGILQGKYNLFQYYTQGIQTLRAIFRKKSRKSSKPSEVPFQQKMLNGLDSFGGAVLLVMSGNSLLSQEFDTLVEYSREWQAVFARSKFTRIDKSAADQTFSTVNARDDLISTIQSWISETAVESEPLQTGQ